MIDNCFLISYNNFNAAQQVENNSNSFPVVLDSDPDYCGIIMCKFQLFDHVYVAVKCSEHKHAEHISEIELFGLLFKGFIVRLANVSVKEKEITYIEDTKKIDTEQIFYIEDTNNQENIAKIVKLLDTDPHVFGKIIKRVRINCVECLLIEQIQPRLDDQTEFYAKINDVEIISNLGPLIKYRNNVIIDPSSILSMEPIPDMSYKLQDLVRFEDITEQSYEGNILWAGKVNGLKAAMIGLKDNSSIDYIRAYAVNRGFKEFPECPVGTLVLCVAQLALKHDTISYRKFGKTNMDVVDPKYKHPFNKGSYTEKLLTFTCKEQLFLAILKWKGFIYNQLSIGCQLNYESEEGSNGTYGSEELFKCPLKTGIIITADKVNSNSINGICEFCGAHKNIELKTTKFGYKIYVESSICCIEHKDELEGLTKLKIGCQILYDNKIIGICKFIGNVNGQPTVGIETDQCSFDDNALFFDCINFYAFKGKKWNFINAGDVTVGSFYSKITPEEKHKELESYIDGDVKYYPDNNTQDPPLCGKVKWFGMHGNVIVCGVDLENEYTGLASNYLLENGLFEWRNKHGVIDDFNKMEIVDKYCLSETGACFSTKHSSQCNHDKLVKLLLMEKSSTSMLKIAKIAIPFYTKDIVKYIQDNKATLQLENIPSILELLYRHNAKEYIITLINNHEIVNTIWPRLLSLFSSCIEDNQLKIVEEVLTHLSIPKDNIEANSVCLQLAIKCLEKMAGFDSSGFHGLYKSLIDKCSDKTVFITQMVEAAEETFLTTIIINNCISEKTVIDVLHSRVFNINQRNSVNKTPLELAIDRRKCDIVLRLFEMDYDKIKLIPFLQPLYQDPSQNANVVLMLKILEAEIEKRSESSTGSSIRKSSA